MPLIAPVLDDRTFEQLYAELRNRIPVYNPEWTDYNESDPAITLLQLFAFLGEGLQFRFNQVPEATQLAFLKLLDLPLRPAGPATALVRFKTDLAAGAAIYAGDELRAGKAVFTVETEARVWPVDCLAIARKPAAPPNAIDEPELHNAVQGTIDAVKRERPGVQAVAHYSNVPLASDGSSPPLDFTDAVDGCVWIAVLKDPAVAIELAPGAALQLNLGFSPSPRAPAIAQVKACPGEVPAPGPTLEWRASAKALAADRTPRFLGVRVRGDSTAGFAAEGVVRLELPRDLAQLGVPEAPAGLEGTGDFPPPLEEPHAGKLWFWLRAWRTDDSRVGEARVVCVNAVECVAAAQATPELLGTGSGQPGQVFRLAHRPVLLDARRPVKLQVEEAGSWQAWTQRDDLDASGEADRHFTVDAEAGTVRFGERFPQIGERVRVDSYRHGGGAAGNVPAHAISRIGRLFDGPASQAPMARTADLEADNPFPAAGGFDSESLEEALARIPGDLRRRTRAVTRDDFAELAMMTPGVELGRAECMPLFHAPTQSMPRPGVVSVVVWPARDPRHPDAPLPDAYQLKRVCRWLDAKRLVTTELYVIPPTYRRIALSLAVKVKDGFGLDAVRDWVELVLRQYLAPLPPHGPEGRGWPLGRRVLDRELEGIAMQVEGVEYVAELRAAGWDGTRWVTASPIALAAWEVPELAAISVVGEGTDVPEPGHDALPPAGPPAVPVPVLREEC